MTDGFCSLLGWPDEAPCSCGGIGVRLVSTWERSDYECRGTPSKRTLHCCYAPDACKRVFSLRRDPEPPQEMVINSEKVRDGIRIYVEDAETDTLAVIYVTKGRDTLTVRSGLRGNWSAHRRPIQWVTHSIKARKMNRAQQARAKSDYMRRKGIR